MSTVPDTGLGERWPGFGHREIVAATLIQQPRYVDAVDERALHRRRPRHRPPPRR
ncbi:hypothetical protein [Streptomyces sp. yr375]|uniref:hypothetical protein n=1 Tax=Streptomyces sp. yr375 TaxID=1761906 RepID=UPI00210B35B5|nr:hypothetical protein [Streptomyces sp. yr375]